MNRQPKIRIMPKRFGRRRVWIKAIKSIKEQNKNLEKKKQNKGSTFLEIQKRRARMKAENYQNTTFIEHMLLTRHLMELYKHKLT
jgi:ribosomal 30S subunit maturation factor RimM